jgi:hypothetical protein
MFRAGFPPIIKSLCMLYNLLMYGKSKVLEIGRLVGILLAVIDVLFQLSLVV